MLSGNIQVVDASGRYYACYLDRIYYNAAGQQVGDGNQNNAVYAFDPVAPCYQYAEATPATATQMSVRAVFDSNPPAAGVAFVMYLQHVKLEAGANFTGWNDTASQVTTSASVIANSAAIATLQGQLYATYTLTATAGNVVTGLQLISASGAQTISAIVFQAENFLIKSSASSVVHSPFAYDSTTGTLSLQNIVVGNAVIGTAAIGTLNLVGGSVSMTFILTNSASIPIGPGGGVSTTAPSAPPSGGSSGGTGATGSRGSAQP